MDLLKGYASNSNSSEERILLVKAVSQMNAKLNVFGSKETIFSHLPRVTTSNHE